MCVRVPMCIHTSYIHTRIRIGVYQRTILVRKFSNAYIHAHIHRDIQHFNRVLRSHVHACIHACISSPTQCLLFIITYTSTCIHTHNNTYTIQFPLACYAYIYTHVYAYIHTKIHTYSVPTLLLRCWRD